jgi:hypothetical protein
MNKYYQCKLRNGSWIAYGWVRSKTVFRGATVDFLGMEWDIEKAYKMMPTLRKFLGWTVD